MALDWRRLASQALRAAVRTGAAELTRRATRRGRRPAGSRVPSHRARPRRGTGSAGTGTTGTGTAGTGTPSTRTTGAGTTGTGTTGTGRPPYAGDFTGRARLEYAPEPDGQADPGEIVWTWVPYEEDFSRGKDRPVLVVARDGGLLLALMLTSRDHDGPDAQDDPRHGRQWVDIGPGAWDPRGRPSEVRIDRVLRIDPAAVRREGARLDAGRFEVVASALRRTHGWG